jgi:hypothetical protein
MNKGIHCHWLGSSPYPIKSPLCFRLGMSDIGVIEDMEKRTRIRL